MRFTQRCMLAAPTVEMNDLSLSGLLKAVRPTIGAPKVTTRTTAEFTAVSVLFLMRYAMSCARAPPRLWPVIQTIRDPRFAFISATIEL